ncbi:MAG: hypothetical protein V4620_14745 [Bacteroidota bacterium]
MKKFTLFFLLLGIQLLFKLQAQQVFNYSFYKSLINQKENEVALLYLYNCSQITSNPQLLDSVFFFSGKLLFDKKAFSPAVNKLNKITGNSVFAQQARLYEVIGLTYLDSSEQYIISRLPAHNPSDSVFNQIVNISHAAIALIKNNIQQYDSLHHTINDSLYYYQSLKATLNKWRVNSAKHKKSPLVAAGLSVIVPGLGKVYANKPYDGLSTFLTHIPLALILIESQSKAGVNSPRFITFSAIASLFYIGNIWSSYFYILKHRKEVNFDRKNEILLQCNVMLRSYYN